jgi:rhodanese-related sulfurtransferase
MKAVVALLAAVLAAQTLPDVEPARVSQRDFKMLLAAHRIVVVDVRSANAFGVGHIPTARSLPLDTADIPDSFAATAAALKASAKPVVIYCACAGDSGSVRAARLLAQQGVTDARVLTGGWVDWFNAGNRIARGPK